MKLNKLNETFNQIKAEKVLFALLDQNIETVIPIDEPTLLSNMRRLSDYSRMQNKAYSQYFLQLHTQDKTWLANYVRIRACFIPEIIESDLNIPLTSMLKYVKNSAKFQQRCAEYEQAMTKAYIQVHQTDDKDFYYSEEKIKQERSQIFYNYLFRENVVKAMTSLGLDKRNVEISLEKNRAMWIVKARRQTFDHLIASEKVDGLKGRALSMHNLAVMKKIQENENEMFYTWNTICESNYYQENKKVIDQLNLATPEMKIKGEKKKEFNQKLFNLSSLRRELIEELNPADNEPIAKPIILAY